VDFGADENAIMDHFRCCGEIVRVTILKFHHTQQPKGHAYIEFANKESALKAKHLNESLFRGRQLTVEPKRKNKPGMGRRQ
jgi:polyadenylate-binding protein 2